MEKLALPQGRILAWEISERIESLYFFIADYRQIFVSALIFCIVGILNTVSLAINRTFFRKQDNDTVATATPANYTTPVETKADPLATTKLPEKICTPVSGGNDAEWSDRLLLCE